MTQCVPAMENKDATVGAQLWPVGLSRSASLDLSRAFRVATRCSSNNFSSSSFFKNFEASSLVAVSLVYFSAKPAGSGGMEPGTAILPIWFSDSIKCPSCQLMWLAPFAGRCQQLLVVQLLVMVELNLLAHLDQNLVGVFGFQGGQGSGFRGQGSGVRG